MTQRRNDLHRACPGSGIDLHRACPGGVEIEKTTPVPIYTPDTAHIVHSLRYDWTGWLKEPANFPQTLSAAIGQCRAGWETDGLELDAWQAEGNRLQCLFTAKPDTSPSHCANRAKGRLQHALRQQGTPVDFSRRVGMRTLGDNTRPIVERYIARQVGKSDYVDPRFKEYLGRFTVENAGVILAEPQATGHGRYWYNLHLVMVVADRRHPITRPETFIKVREGCFRIAEKKGCQLAEVSVMPDHVHLALRGNIELSPEGIGLAYLNNLAYLLGYNRCWSEEFYVGTFSEYAVSAITENA